MLALKVDVDTLRGTRIGVPRLVNALEAAGAGATFLFSVGPDHTGRALRRVFRPGFLSKVSRTSVVEHYGIKTLLYGTLLPGPDIGRSCRDQLRAVAAAGFETGLHTYDHAKWQDFVADKDRAWTEREMRAGIDAFTRIFGDVPRVHGAAGWQMNDAAFELEDPLGFDYASDTRGEHPFLPVAGTAPIACPQVPTTLPTLDELIGVDGMSAEDAAGRVLGLTAAPRGEGHVYTLHAELEGMRLLPVFEDMLGKWKAQGYRLVSLRDYFARFDRAALPRHRVVMAAIEGRSGVLARQGAIA